MGPKFSEILTDGTENEDVAACGFARTPRGFRPRGWHVERLGLRRGRLRLQLDRVLLCHG